VKTKQIAEMLTYRRAHDSAGEHEFIARYIAPHAAPISDTDGTVYAYACDIGNAPRVAFCAHTDSVHNRTLAHARQRVSFDATRKEFFVGDKAQRDCLGADNAAGVFVLLQMIAARVPGRYFFFRGEERGGIGSTWLVNNRPDLLDGIRAAIAFDRRDTHSVITHMSVGRTCSDAFADSLADALNMGHERDDTGSFTDTATLAEFVPECTNVSVGYDDEHSARETLNARYLIKLAAACIAAFRLGSDALVIEREPGAFIDESAAALDSFGELTDDEISELVYGCDGRQLVDILIKARDEISELTWNSWTPSPKRKTRAKWGKR
jgi:hypothetical protein